MSVILSRPKKKSSWFNQTLNLVKASGPVDGDSAVSTFGASLDFNISSIVFCCGFASKGSAVYQIVGLKLDSSVTW